MFENLKKAITTKRTMTADELRTEGFEEGVCTLLDMVYSVDKKLAEDIVDVCADMNLKWNNKPLNMFDILWNELEDLKEEHDVVNK